MSPTQETVLSTIAGASDEERLLVVLIHSVAVPIHSLAVLGSAGASRLELRQQSWGDGVGWFTQSRVELRPDQVADLRSALGASDCSRSRPNNWPNLRLNRFQAESA